MSSLYMPKQFVSHLLSKCFLFYRWELLDVDNHTPVHDDFMFTKAIFSKALAYAGRSLLDEMLLDNEDQWHKLHNIDSISLPKKDKFWQQSNVTMNDNGKIKNN